MAHIGASLRDVPDTLRQRPRVVVLILAVALFLSVTEWVTGPESTIGGWIYLLTYPAFLAGSIHVLATESSSDDPRAAFWRGVRTNYWRLVAAFLALFVVAMLLVALLVTIVVVAVIAIGSTNDGVAWQSSLTALQTEATAMADGGLNLVNYGLGSYEIWGAVLAGGGFLAISASQFFDVAIVIDDASATDGLKRSLALFRAAPGSVVGYSLVRAALVRVTFELPSTVATISTYAGVDLAIGGTAGSFTVVGALSAIVLVPLGQVILLSYHVSFYGRLTDTEATRDGPTATAAPAD